MKFPRQAPAARSLRDFRKQMHSFALVDRANHDDMPETRVEVGRSRQCNRFANDMTSADTKFLPIVLLHLPGHAQHSVALENSAKQAELPWMLPGVAVDHVGCVVQIDQNVLAEQARKKPFP